MSKMPAVLSAYLALSFSGAALAQGESPPPMFMKDDPARSLPPATAAAPKPGLMSLPSGAAGAFVGLVVGVPVKVTRTMVSESKRMFETIHDDMGGRSDPVNGLIALSIGVPYGIASGAVLGSIRGVENGVKYGYAKPFSRESMGWDAEDE